MPYPHYAHLKDITVLVGQIVEAGAVIGHVGDTGAPGNSHLHFEVQINHPKDHPHGAYTGYTEGMNSIQVQQLYENPSHYLEGKIQPLEGPTHLGYGFLQVNSKGQLHPGLDLNKGAGYDDYGLPVRTVERSKVIAVRNDKGWGNHIFCEPTNELTKEQMDEINKRLDAIEALNREQDKAHTAIFKRLDALEQNLIKRASKNRVRELEQEVDKIK